MVAHLPLIKLASMAVRQISKPLVVVFKNRAKKNGFFRNYVCMPSAQIYHLYETRLKMQLLGLGKPTEVKKLNEDMAVELGAEILGEFIVFGIGAACLTLEVLRNSYNDSSKEAAQNDKLNELTNKINSMSVKMDMQSAKITELSEKVEKKK